MIRPFLLLAMLCAVAIPASDHAPEPFRDGARVVFFGDSLTQGGTFHAWVQLFYATRFPDRRIRCCNAGIGGATLSGSLARLEREALTPRSEVVVALFGMNDVNRSLYMTAVADERTQAARERALAGYRSALTTLLERLAAAGTTAVVVTPMPYDQYHAAIKTENAVACNDGLASITAIAREVAGARGSALIDLHTPMTAALRQSADWMPAKDRVHPDAVGHLVAACWFLKALGVTGTVARSLIDAKSAAAGTCDNCLIEDLARTGKVLSFTYRAKALPFPTSQDFAKAASLAPWAELNREVLQVTGLGEGRYALRLGGLAAGTFSAADFATGIELAALDTPQQRQAQKLREAVLRKVAADAPLRSVAKMEEVLRSHRIDPADRAAADPFLDAFPAKSSSKAYYEWEIGNYRKARDNAAANAQALEQAFAAIHALQVFAPVRVEITPAL